MFNFVFDFLHDVVKWLKRRRDEFVVEEMKKKTAQIH